MAVRKAESSRPPGRFPRPRRDPPPPGAAAGAPLFLPRRGLLLPRSVPVCLPAGPEQVGLSAKVRRCVVGTPARTWPKDEDRSRLQSWTVRDRACPGASCRYPFTTLRGWVLLLCLGSVGSEPSCPVCGLQPVLGEDYFSRRSIHCTSPIPASRWPRTPGNHPGQGEPARQGPGRSPSLDAGVLDGAQSSSEQGEGSAGHQSTAGGRAWERLRPSSGPR